MSFARSGTAVSHPPHVGWGVRRAGLPSAWHLPQPNHIQPPGVPPQDAAVPSDGLPQRPCESPECRIVNRPSMSLSHSGAIGSAGASANGFPPLLPYLSGIRDRPSEAILRLVDSPKRPLLLQKTALGLVTGFRHLLEGPKTPLLRPATPLSPSIRAPPTLRSELPVISPRPSGQWKIICLHFPSHTRNQSVPQKSTRRHPPPKQTLVPPLESGHQSLLVLHEQSATAGVASATGPNIPMVR